MKNFDEVLQGCADCIAVCKSASRTTWFADKLSKEEVCCAKMWNDCATICEACIHLVGRGSPYADQMLNLCATITEDCYKACQKHKDVKCSKVANACKKCSELCKKWASECRKCA